MVKRLGLLLALIGGAVYALAAEQLAVSTHNESPPADLAPPIAALLTSQGVTAKLGSTSVQFWLVKQLPIRSAATDTPAAWANVAEGTLVGAARVSGPISDIRGRTLKPGVYTLRFGIQPADGAHLGVSPHREFLLLCPAAFDSDPAPLDHDSVVRLSARSLGITHPAVWSLDPPVAPAGETPRIAANSAGHQAVTMRVPLMSGGHPAGELIFGVILVGVIDA
jgi:hypothetical protein